MYPGLNILDTRFIYFNFIYTTGYLLEPRCTWSEYVGYRIRLKRNYRTGNYETKILNPTQVMNLYQNLKDIMLKKVYFML